MIVFPSASSFTIPALQQFLSTQTGYTAARVAEKVIAGEALMVTVVQAGGSGPFNTLAERTIRVNVYASTSALADGLTARVIGFLTGEFRDGNPVVDAVVNAGPEEVPSEAGKERRYVVIDLTIRGVQQ